MRSDPRVERVTRRSVLAGIAGGITMMTAGCLGDDSPIASCSSSGVIDSPIQQVIPVQGSDQISLGIVVDGEVPSSTEYENIVVRNRDNDLVADIPLESNRYMSETDPNFPTSMPDGELYAVPLGPPPQHGDVTVELVDAEGTVTSVSETRFNCYATDGDLP